MFLSIVAAFSIVSMLSKVLNFRLACLMKIPMSLALLSALGCTDQEQVGTLLLDVSPRELAANMPVSLVLSGSGLGPQWPIALDQREPIVDISQLGVRIGEELLPSQTTTSRRANQLVVRLATGLAAGTYDVSVRNNSSPWQVLSDILIVGESGSTSAGVMPPAEGGDAGASEQQESADSGVPTTSLPIDAGTSTKEKTVACDSSQLELIACYEFEQLAGASQLLDSSSYGHTITVGGAQFAAGVQGNALQTDVNFDSNISANSNWDIGLALTMEAWIEPAGDVDSGRQGIFDNQAEYGFFAVPTNALTCSVGRTVLQTAEGLIEPAQWQHIACVYDNGSLSIYRNGQLVANTTIVRGLGTGGSTEITLGQNSPDGEKFIGKLDTVRIWTSARTPDQLCESALSECQR